MSKVLINITIFILFIGVVYWTSTLIPDIQKEIIPDGLNYCLIDSDCVVFGETGDCNCGCYNKNHLPSEVKGECFCLAPATCGCVDGKCEGVSKDVSKDVSGEINNFNDCVNNGYAVMESYPRQCRTSNKTFTEDHCMKEDTGGILTLSDAEEIAINSECGGNLKETFVCNKVTGTYWIDLSLEKEGCNPACVIDVENRTVSINWRCTGLIQ